jgi:hypothetical protein
MTRTRSSGQGNLKLRANLRLQKFEMRPHSGALLDLWTIGLEFWAEGEKMRTGKDAGRGRGRYRAGTDRGITNARGTAGVSQTAENVFKSGDLQTCCLILDCNHYPLITAITRAIQVFFTIVMGESPLGHEPN